MSKLEEACKDYNQAICEINGHYQEIEDALTHDGLFLQQKLDRIAEINKKIGAITAEYL